MGKSFVPNGNISLYSCLRLRLFSLSQIPPTSTRRRTQCWWTWGKLLIWYVWWTPTPLSQTCLHGPFWWALRSAQRLSVMLSIPSVSNWTLQTAQVHYISQTITVLAPYLLLIHTRPKSRKIAFITAAWLKGTFVSVAWPRYLLMPLQVDPPSGDTVCPAFSPPGPAFFSSPVAFQLLPLSFSVPGAPRPSHTHLKPRRCLA